MYLYYAQQDTEEALKNKRKRGGHLKTKMNGMVLVYVILGK
jgi:hypothetical protein